MIQAVEIRLNWHKTIPCHAESVAGRMQGGRKMLAYLQGKLGECAAVLVNTATDTEVPAQIRVNAANAALSQCSQWTKNVDMIERLEAMEELMSRVEQEQKSQRRRT